MVDLEKVVGGNERVDHWSHDGDECKTHSLMVVDVAGWNLVYSSLVKSRDRVLYNAVARE